MKKAKIYRLKLRKSTNSEQIEKSLSKSLQEGGKSNYAELLRVDQLKNETIVFFAGNKRGVQKFSSSLRRVTKDATSKLEEVSKKELMKFPK